MKLRQISFKIISMIMVFTMLFGASATTISAVTWEHEDHVHENGKDEIYYVSLGDSMTNGYGLDGYHGNTGVEDYGYGSYANQFAEWLGAEHAQLAMSAMRAEDLHWILEVDYTDPAVIEVVETLASNPKYYEENIEEFNALWYSVFTNGDYWTWVELVNDYRLDVAAYCIEGKDQTDGGKFNADYKVAYGEYDDVEALQIVAEYYQKSVSNADVISLGIGNGNFGVFMFGRIMEAIGFDGEPDEAMIYRVENAICELDPAMQARVLALKVEVEATLKNAMAGSGAFGSTEGEGTSAVDALVNTMVYATLSFVLNYAGTVDALVELNPNAEIILVALMNTFDNGESNLGVEDLDNILNNGMGGAMDTFMGLTFGDLLKLLYTPLNAFIAGYPTYLQLRDQFVKAQVIDIENRLQAEISKIEAEANAQADALKAEADAKLAVLTEELKDATGVAKIKVQAEIAKIKAELEKSVDEIAAKADFDSSLVINKIEEELLVSLKSVNAGCVDGLKDYVLDLNDYVEGKINALNERAEAQIALLNAMLQNTTEEAKAEIEAAIAKVNSDLEVAVAEVLEAADAQIAQVKAELEVALPVVEAIAKEQYEAAKAEIDAKIAELEAQLPVVAEAVKAEIKAEIAALNAELEALRVEINAQAAADIKALIDDATVEVAKLEAEANAQVELLKAQAKSQLLVLEAELTLVTEDAKAQLLILKADLLAKYEELKAQAEAQLNILNAQLEDATDDAKAVIEAEIAKVKAEYKRTLDALNAQYEVAIAKLHETEAQVKAAIYAEIERIDAELEDAVAEIKTHLDNAIVDANAKIDAELNVAVNAILAEIDTVNAELNTSLADIYAELKGQIADLKETADEKVEEIANKVLDKLGNSNNHFYYAEADKVECMVEVYEDELKIKGSTTRKRFVESIVGTKDKPGMVWKLLKAPYISLAEIEAYEDMTKAEKLAYVQENGTTVLMYLGFERAIVASVNGSPVSVNSVLGLGELNIDADAMFEKLNEKAVAMQALNHVKNEAGEYDEDDYIRAATKYVDDALTTELNKGLSALAALGVPGDYKQVDLVTLANALNIAVSKGYATKEEATQLIGVYVFKTSVSGVRSAARYPGTAMKNMTKSFLGLGYTEDEAKVYAESAYNTVYDNYMLAYTGLVTPELLAEVVLENSELAGLCSLFARCVIGNGLGGHPSKGGHDTLFEAVKAAYDEGYTAKDQTVQNLKDSALILAGLALRYYDEAYAHAYKELYDPYIIDTIDEFVDLQMDIDNLIADIQKNHIENPEYAEYHDLLKLINTELGNISYDIELVIDLLEMPEITEETWKTLDYLYEDLLYHHDTLVELVAELNEIAENHTNETIAELKAQTEKQIVILNAQVEKQIATLNAQAEKQIATLKADLEAELLILNGELQTAVGEAKAEIQAEIDRLQAEYNACVAEIQAKLQAEIDRLQAEHDALVAELNAKLDAEIEALKAQVNAQLDVLNGKLEVLNSDLLVAIEKAEDLAKQIDAFVNEYILGVTAEEYAAFVDAAVAALGHYSHEAAIYGYDWLYNNPEKVIEFFVTYGDEIGEFFGDYGIIILQALSLVGVNYGDDIFNLVLNNADVILPAIADWYDIHGEYMWDLLVVYFNAIVAYYNLGLDLDLELDLDLDGDIDLDIDIDFDFNLDFDFDIDLDLDFSSLEGIHASFDRIFRLLGDIIDMVKNGDYDFIAALDIMSKIEAELTKLNTYLNGLLNGYLGQLDQFVDAKLEVVYDYFQAQIDALRALVAEQIAALEAQAQKQIEALKAQIWAQIEVLNKQLETAVGEAREEILAEIARLEAFLEAEIARINADLAAQIAALNAKLEEQIAALKAELEALVDAELNSIEDAKVALDKLLQKGVKALGQYVYEAVAAFVEDAIAGEFTPTEDTDYVSVNGGSADYADLLAGKLSETLDSPIDLDKMDWSNLDYDKLAEAELITLGYDENELSAFAISQMLGYIENYIDEDLRGSTLTYSDKLVDTLVVNLLNKYTILDWVIGDYEKEIVNGYADALINGVADALVGKADISSDWGLDETTTEALKLLTGSLKDKEVEELDWAKYVGAENLHYVDEARQEIRNELVANGVVETYTITIRLVNEDIHKTAVDYLESYIAELGLVGTIKEKLDETIAQLRDYNNFIALFGDYADYTIEIPVLDSLVFAAESYLYSNVEFQAEYGQLIVDLYEINPEAVIILLGHYNAYDYELVLGDLEINLGDAYGYVAGVSSLQPFAYALLSEKIAYVDIYEAETVFESLVAAGAADNSLVHFLMMYLKDSSITDVSEAGNEYIYNQILHILTIGCDHKYDHACDDTCNKCGAHREVPGHVYDNACDKTCNVPGCGFVREVGDHEYVDGVCIHCGHKLPVAPPAGDGDGPTEPNADCLAGNHNFDDCDDTQCNKCDYTRAPLTHVYDNCEDASCNNCGKVRVAPGHVYTSGCDATCDRCGESRTVAGHVYSGCTDTDCNVCGEKRTASAHVVDDCTDTECNVCGQNVAATGHKFGEWTVTAEATRKTAGEKCRVCTICNLKETKIIEALGGLGGGAIAGIVVGSTVVAAAAGFAIYWFLLQKKTFAALVEGVKGLFGGAAAEAAPAAAGEAPATEAPATEAPAKEEETK